MEEAKSRGRTTVHLDDDSQGDLRQVRELWRKRYGRSFNFSEFCRDSLRRLRVVLSQE